MQESSQLNTILDWQEINQMTKNLMYVSLQFQNRFLQSSGLWPSFGDTLLITFERMSHKKPAFQGCEGSGALLLRQLESHGVQKHRSNPLAHRGTLDSLLTSPPSHRDPAWHTGGVCPPSSPCCGQSGTSLRH